MQCATNCPAALENRTEPKRLLDAANIISLPIPLHHFLLSNWHTGPSHPHDGHSIHVILVKEDLLSARVSFRPLRQSPSLDELLGRFQSDILPRDISVKDGEFPTRLGSFEDSRWCSRKCRESLRIGECLIHFLGSCTEFICCCDGGGVDGCLARAIPGGCDGLGRGRGSLLLRMPRRCRDAAGRIGP